MAVFLLGLGFLSSNMWSFEEIGHCILKLQLPIHWRKRHALATPFAKPFDNLSSLKTWVPADEFAKVLNMTFPVASRWCFKPWVNIAEQTCSVCDSHQTSEVWTRSDNGHWRYNSLQFSGERANFMAPAWPRPLTYVRAFDNSSSLRPLEQTQWVWQELDQGCRRSSLKYKPNN